LHREASCRIGYQALWRGWKEGAAESKRIL